MNIIVIFNGLGNQMSQYAFYLQKKKHDEKTIFILDKKTRNAHNGFELVYVFGIEFKNDLKKEILYYIFRLLQVQKFTLAMRPLKTLLKYCGFELYSEAKNYDFDERSLASNSTSIRFFQGGWHSEKYFNSIKSELYKVFDFKKVSDESLQSYLGEIERSQSVSIHVRRGDYISTELNFKMYGSVCNLGYYTAAISQIKRLVPNPKFFVFSNDIKWVKANSLFDGMTVVEGFDGKDSWKDMYLISQCKHNINSNSTFSWWSAWLNRNKDKKVIVPYYFINHLETKDFYPEEWIKLSDY